MSDFLTVIVSNDDCVSLGIFTPHDTNPAMVQSTKVAFNDFIFILFAFCLLYILIILFIHFFTRTQIVGEVPCQPIALLLQD